MLIGVCLTGSRDLPSVAPIIRGGLGIPGVSAYAVGIRIPQGIKDAICMSRL